MSEDSEVSLPDEPPLRPRFGKVIRKDGTEQQLVFYPTDDPDIFDAVDPKSEHGLVLGAGDIMNIDYLGTHQSVRFARGNSQFSKQSAGHLAGPKKEDSMARSENAPKDPNGWWKGLVMMAGLGAIIVLTVAGINWAISL